MLHDAFLFLAAGIVCAAFGLIYEIFSHEVYSFYMIYAFLILLVPGTLLNLVIVWRAVRKEKYLRIKEAAARSAANAGFSEKISAESRFIDNSFTENEFAVGRSAGNAFEENVFEENVFAEARKAGNTGDALVADPEEIAEIRYPLSNEAETQVSTGVFFPGRFTRYAWNSGLAALTAGSIFKGILDIYGTTNKLIVVYPAASAVLICAAVISYLLSYAAVRKVRRKAEVPAV